MRLVAIPPTPIFSATAPSSTQYQAPHWPPSKDTARFGSDHSHTHTGKPCNGKHPHDHTSEKPEKEGWFRRLRQKLTSKSTKSEAPHHHGHTHNHEDCQDKHCHHAHESWTDNTKYWLGEAAKSVKAWFGRAYQHFKNDLVSVHNWLSKKFPNALKRK